MSKRNPPEALAKALKERDDILLAMDVEKAKAFVVQHGGTAPPHLDWVRILHLARFEVTSMPDEAKTDSHIWLAAHGAKSISMYPQDSPYVLVTLNLIFPKHLTDAYIKSVEGVQG